MLEEQTGIKLIDERIDNSKRLSGTLISKITLDKKITYVFLLKIYRLNTEKMHLQAFI